MDLIDRDKLILHYDGLAKISPTDFIGTCEYFANQIKAIPPVDPVHAAGGCYCHECINKNCCKIEELFIEMKLEQDFRFCGCGEKYDDICN